MIKTYYIFFIYVLCTACYTKRIVKNNNISYCTPFTKTDTSMLYFDIKAFENAKKTIDQQWIIEDNDVLIKRWQRYNNEGFYEILKYKKEKNIAIEKYYYPNTKLQEIGKSYLLGDVQIGIWDYYEANGKYKCGVNYDTIYPICWKEAIDIATKNGIDKKQAWLNHPPYFERGKPKPTRACWTVKDQNTGLTVEIDAYTGIKVSKRVIPIIH